MAGSRAHLVLRRYAGVCASVLLAAVLFRADAAAASLPPRADRYFRVNQLGYAAADPKAARVLSRTNLSGASYTLVRLPEETIVLSGHIQPSSGRWGTFGFSHVVDFSDYATAGSYRLRLPATGEQSLPFRIGVGPNGESRYRVLARALNGFFAVQRCGDTDPLLHDPCHPLDATTIVGGPDAGSAADETGGWHDAGDYIKFLTTAAFTTHFLLLAYEISPGVAGDEDANGISDLLDEARIGADWLLKLRYVPNRFLYQVQDARDHGEGWRMPEDDDLYTDRPAFYGVGKNHLGRLAAALARASRAFATLDPDYAVRCRSVAVEAYAAAATAPDITGGDFYGDDTWRDKMELGAVELYRTTGSQAYLNEARAYADQAGPAWWFSWGNLNGIAHALLASDHPPCLDYLRQDLDAFRSQSDTHPWGMTATEVWGVNGVLAGAACEALLYERLTGQTGYRAMAFRQRDFLLGTNPWGVCFIGDQGQTFPRDFHHQVAYLANGGALSGCVTEGPAPAAQIAEQNIQLFEPDEYAEFQDARGVYQDDRGNYVTNEPTLFVNATVLLFTALLYDREAGASNVVEGNSSAGGPAAPLLAWPNPTSGPVRLEMRTPEPGREAVSFAGRDRPLQVFSAGGALVRRLSLRSGRDGGWTGFWDGRIESGRPAPAGVYWVRGAGQTSARVVIVQ